MSKISKKCVIDKNEEKCATGKKYDSENKTCFSMDQLIKIANLFNEKYPNEQINITNNKRQLLKDLILKYKNKYNCGDQSCWLNTDIIKNTNDNDLKNTLKPIGPNESKDWLSTFDINKVLKQYENKYNNFKYLGTVPYDFEELPVLGISSLNFTDLMNNGINKLGMVINLDNHNQNGSHWVAFYSDLAKKHIYFLIQLVKNLEKRLKTLLKDFITILTLIFLIINMEIKNQFINIIKYNIK